MEWPCPFEAQWAASAFMALLSLATGLMPVYLVGGMSGLRHRLCPWSPGQNGAALQPSSGELLLSLQSHPSTPSPLRNHHGLVPIKAIWRLAAGKPKPKAGPASLFPTHLPDLSSLVHLNLRTGRDPTIASSQPAHLGWEVGRGIQEGKRLSQPYINQPFTFL